MATLIKTTGARKDVTPADGRESFKLIELQSIVGGYIEAVRLSGDLIMWVNEEGKLKGLPVNPEATRMAAFCASICGRPWTDPIVGDVVIATRAESGEDDEDEDFGDWADNDTDLEGEGK